MDRYRHHLARIGAAVSLCVAACEGETDGADEADDDASEATLGEGASAIVGGRPEPGRSAVVALIHEEYDHTILVCSGVLITPTIVVTAAHCIHPHVTGYEPDELNVVFGSSMDSPQRMGVLSGAYNPDWRLDDPSGEGDVGALRLAGAAPVDPIAIGPAPTQGGSVVLVGFGSAVLDASAPADREGTKRSGTALVGQVGDSWFRVERAPSTTCAGDSGGATLADVNGAEVLLGIHSRGDCVSELWNERIDTQASGFLKGFMGEYGSCNADGACAMGCPEPDPDCACGADGTCDVACGEEDPDCAPEPCEDLPPDGSSADCCDDGACGQAPSNGGDWGSAGCTVESSGASRTSGALAALCLGAAAVSAWSRRRHRR